MSSKLQPESAAVPSEARVSAVNTLRRHRSPLLDSIRGVAILSVLIYHVATRYEYAALDPIAHLARRYGLLGVDVFFPLSGYLITRYLLQAKRPGSIKVFFQRRFFRIVPLYLVAVTVFLAVSLLVGLEQESIARIWITYLFLTGWFIFFEGTATVPYTITWSLSVEEFAYIIFGLSALVMRRRFLTFLIVICVGSMVFRGYLNLNGMVGVYNFPPARLDSIAIGGIAAVLMDRRVRGLALFFGVSALSIYLLALLVTPLWSTLKYTFIALGTCFLIVLFETRFSQVRNRPLHWLASIGFYSYFTYLFHLFNIHILLTLWKIFDLGSGPPFWGVVIVALGLTHTQAVLSFRFFEGPIMRYGRRLENRKERAEKNPTAPENVN